MVPPIGILVKLSAVAVANRRYCTKREVPSLMLDNQNGPGIILDQADEPTR